MKLRGGIVGAQRAEVAPESVEGGVGEGLRRPRTARRVEGAPVDARAARPHTDAREQLGGRIPLRAPQRVGAAVRQQLDGGAAAADVGAPDDGEAPTVQLSPVQNHSLRTRTITFIYLFIYLQGPAKLMELS